MRHSTDVSNQQLSWPQHTRALECQYYGQHRVNSIMISGMPCHKNSDSAQLCYMFKVQTLPQTSINEHYSYAKLQPMNVVI